MVHMGLLEDLKEVPNQDVPNVKGTLIGYNEKYPMCRKYFSKGTVNGNAKTNVDKRFS